MSYKHFSAGERDFIQLGLGLKRSARSIATELGRSPSSVSREIKRNLPQEFFRYTSRLAHERALKGRHSRGREERLKNDRVRSYVVSRLKLRWSPEQISGRIRIDLGETVSHEAVYQFIYAQIHRDGYGHLKPGREDLRLHLRRRRKRRIPRDARRCQRVFRPLGESIDARPTIVGERLRVGDWEGDTVESKDHRPGINTLVERKTGLVLITRLTDRTSLATSTAVTMRLLSLPKELRCTLTLDRGSENSAWSTIELTAGVKCFFAHAYHSWERGANENINGLIRDYFPKKTDFTTVPDVWIARVEYDLNTRPRKRLGWRTPLEAMGVALQG